MAAAGSPPRPVANPRRLGVEDSCCDGQLDYSCWVTRRSGLGSGLAAFQWLDELLTVAAGAVDGLVDFFRMQGGMQAEHWGGPDMLSFLQQLGVMPGPGAPA